MGSEMCIRDSIYIGQPPLYKIKHGKQEQYLKDDAELSEYLLARALDDAQLVYDTDVPPLTGTGLETLMKRYQAVQRSIRRLSNYYSAGVLQSLLGVKKLDATGFDQPEKMAEWAEELSALLNADTGPSDRYEVEITSDGLVVHEYTHGVSTQRLLPPEFFDGADYRAMMELGEQISGLIQPGASVHQGDRNTEVSSFGEAEAWLMEQAKRGQTIQRFKGLGEMNPEQLWDTTVNPETRRLLKVTIEDAVAADDLFSTLMGDVVEPRRDFIEKNALNVNNLDV